jgi:hypothetical protein
MDVVAMEKVQTRGQQRRTRIGKVVYVRKMAREIASQRFDSIIWLFIVGLENDSVAESRLIDVVNVRKGRDLLKDARDGSMPIQIDQHSGYNALG